MDRAYDVFEILADGTLLWRVAVTGHDAAIAELKELAAQNSNEFQVMYLPTKTLIATMNGRKAKTPST